MTIDFQNLSDNPEDLLKAFEHIESGEQLDEKIEPEKINSVEQQEVEQEPEGIATKDSKHIIPYSVLKNERDARSRAEQIARDAQDRVAALEAQVNSVNQGANNGESARTDQTASDLPDDDELEALKEDFPTVYKAVMASIAAAKTLEAKLAPVEESVRNQEAERAQSHTDAVQEAIDSIPKLAHIQATNHEAFELAKQFDAMLRNQNAWADKSLSERFQKVTEMVESALGNIDFKGNQQASQLNAEELKQAAKAKAKESATANRTNVPTSLSEFPAGQHAAQDEKEAVENLSVHQLAERFSSMSADQMDAYFSNL